MTAEDPAPRRQRRGLNSRLVRTVLVVLGLLAAVLLAGLGYELTLPSVADAPARVAVIVRTHGGELGKLPLPVKLGRAVVAVEDEHFYSNALVNIFDGVARAGLAALHTSGDPGGSTIAQQLAKQLYPAGSGLGGTLDQVGMGLKLSLSYSKPQILEMYLNAIYYGNGYWGYMAAARGYFGVSPSELTLVAGRHACGTSAGALRLRPGLAPRARQAAPAPGPQPSWSPITSSPRRSRMPPIRRPFICTVRQRGANGLGARRSANGSRCSPATWTRAAPCNRSSCDPWARWSTRLQQTVKTRQRRRNSWESPQSVLFGTAANRPMPSPTKPSWQRDD